MTPEEKSIIAKELKQVRGFLSAIRTESNAISRELVGMIKSVAAMRASSLSIDVIIEEFEKKLR